MESLRPDGPRELFNGQVFEGFNAPLPLPFGQVIEQIVEDVRGLAWLGPRVQIKLSMMTLPAHMLTILAVEDLARAKRFDFDAFDGSQVVDVSVYVEFALAGGMRLGVYEQGGVNRNTGQIPVRTPPGALSPTELYFDVDDPPSAISRMKTAGARELSPLVSWSWGDEAAYFADPAGNVLVLARRAGAHSGAEGTSG